MKQTWKDVEAKITELGGEVAGGINWTWAHFETTATAQQFHDWLGGEWETRGVYPTTDKDWAGVRFR